MKMRGIWMAGIAGVAAMTGFAADLFQVLESLDRNSPGDTDQAEQTRPAEKKVVPAAPNASDSTTAQTEKTQPPAAPNPKPLPAKPQLNPAPAPTPVATKPAVTHLRLYEQQSVTVCAAAFELRIAIAKQGSQAGDGIYLKAPVQSGRIGVGSSFDLAPGCQFRLDRTGRTTDFYADLSYIEGAN